MNAPGERFIAALRVCSVIAVLGVVCLLSSCSFTRSSHTIHTSSSINVVAPPPIEPELALVPKTVGLFVGVSNYSDRANVYSTPAHTLSAAAIRDTFYQAAAATDRIEIRRKAGLPVDCCFFTNGRVTSLTFSRDGSRIIYGLSDGMIAIRTVDGRDELTIISPKVQKSSQTEESTESTSDKATVAVGMSPEDSSLFSIDAGGGITLWPLSQPAGSRKLQTMCRVRSGQFSPDGSKILVTCADGPMSLWSSHGDSLGQIATSNNCVSPAATAIDSRGEIALAECGEIRILKQVQTDQAVVLGHYTGEIHTLAFSPDDRQILAAGSDGAAIWEATDSSPPRSLGKQFGDAAAGVFSADGSRVVVVFGRKIAVFARDFSSDPKLFYNSNISPKTLQLSADGKYVMWLTTDETWVGDVVSGETRSAHLRNPMRPSENQLPLAIARSSDGRHLGVGFADGLVELSSDGEVVGEYMQREQRLKAEFAILADLRLPEGDPDRKLVVEFLSRMRSAAGLTFNEPGLDEDEDDPFRTNKNKKGFEPLLIPVFGNGQDVTKGRILKTLDETVDKARTLARKSETVLLIVYVSAHGVTGRDGRPYILPADADGKDEDTWISYDTLLEPVYGFIRAQTPSSSAGTKLGIHAIVLLDTCQTLTDLGTQAKGLNTDRLPPGVIVIEGSAQGEYVWHWRGQRVETGFTTVESEHRIGFPLPPKPVPRGSFSNTTNALMSILPVASQQSLNDLTDARKSQLQDDSGAISAMEWATTTSKQLSTMQQDIPEARESGKLQEMQIVTAPNQDDFTLFQVVQIVPSNKPQ